MRVTDSYISLVRKMQEELRRLVFKKGIAIECNPTSNVLIGTFGRYDNHPLIQFNSYGLKGNEDKGSAQLSVFINTDDQGVFDTLLENEYALMACALEKKKDANGNYVYSQDMVYDYLEHIRQMGFEQVFRQ